ncbi:outer membrane protein assembly factor BamB family protein [Stieleria varia]|uniref:Outer membrane biogenesis protein BamB n=1 Tax=Stieleria varia TaxID=2528005 RepID=A0A5C6AWQ9_9BACT|nr:PQQ-binding-like beta-propeller repeat protein [Stieleria varia]TWU04455.1 outer membrane biogenesis protein BamB [Stieleria varia]
MSVPTIVARMLTGTFLILACSASRPFAVATEPEWRKFRGPTENGYAPSDSNPPTQWSTGQNIAWRSELPGEGWSTPVASGGKVYLSAAIPTDEADQFDLSLLIVDFETGKLVSSIALMRQSGDAKIHKKNSHASPTPIVTDDRVYVHFGYQGTACCDRTGKILWTNRDLKFKPTHGNGGTPVLVGDRLIFTCDGDKEPKIVALDAATGELVWQVRRPVDAKKTFSFCTPCVIEVEGRTQVVAPGSDCVLALDPATGETIWDVRYTGYSVVPQPIFDDGRVYVSTSFDNASLLAIRPTGKGIVTETHVDWQTDRNVPKTPSMIAVDGAIYFVSDNGILSSVDGETGDLVYRERLGGGFSASPVYAGGHLYFVDEEGMTTVVKPGDEFQQVARNDLQERTLASPAVIGNAILIRTEKALYRIEQ